MIGQNDPDEKLVSTQDIILKKYIAIILCFAIQSRQTANYISC